MTNASKKGLTHIEQIEKNLKETLEKKKNQEVLKRLTDK